MSDGIQLCNQIGDSCVISAMVDGKCSTWVTCSSSVVPASMCCVGRATRFVTRLFFWSRVSCKADLQPYKIAKITI